MSRINKIFSLLLLCLIPVMTLPVMTGCQTPPDNGGTTRPDIDVRDFINFVETLKVLYGDKLSPEDSQLIDDAIAKLRERLDSGEDLGFEDIVLDVVVPVIADQVVSDMETEKLQQAFTAISAIQLIISNYGGDQWLPAYNALQAVKDIIAQELEDRAGEEGTVSGQSTTPKWKM